jgi:hypothetical protein
MDLGIKNALFVYFHGGFFRLAPAACSFIPLRPKAKDSVAHTEPPGHLLPRVGLGKCWPVRQIPGSLDSFPGSASNGKSMASP